MGNKSVRANLVRLALVVACLCSCEIGTKAVDKYYFYRSQMSAYSPVYCWKTPKGQWACGTLSEHYGDVPPERLLSFMQDELPCSLEEMKGLLDEHYEFYGSYIEPNRHNKVYEVIATTADYSSLNIETHELDDSDIYSALGLENVYRNDFSNPFIDAEDYSKIVNKNDYKKAITNESLIFCWRDAANNWKCGSPFLSKYVTSIKRETITWMQEKMPLSLSEMKGMIDDFCNHPCGLASFKYRNNAVMEIPFDPSEEEFVSIKTALREKNGYSTSRDLYQSLGLEKVLDGKREPFKLKPGEGVKMPETKMGEKELLEFYEPMAEECGELYCWKDDGEYYAIPRRHSSSSVLGLAETYAWLQENMPCPLKLLKRVLPKDYDSFALYEIAYPMMSDGDVRRTSDPEISEILMGL